MPKLSLSRAWEETSAVLARDGRLFVAVALALFVLPGLILSVSMPVAEPGKLPPAGAWIAVAIAVTLIWTIFQLAVLRLAMEPHVSVGEAIVHGARRLLPYIAAMLCWALPILVVGSLLSSFLVENEANPPVAASLGLLLLTAVGTFLGVRMMLSSAVASAENIGPIAILRRSWELSRGNWWRLFAFLLLFVVAALCLVIAAGSIASLLVRLFAEDAGPRSLGGLLIAIVSEVLNGLLSVGFLVMLARIYAQRSGAIAAQPSVPSSGT
jgi:hypothetical protein